MIWPGPRCLSFQRQISTPCWSRKQSSSNLLPRTSSALQQVSCRAFPAFVLRRAVIFGYEEDKNFQDSGPLLWEGSARQCVNEKVVQEAWALDRGLGGLRWGHQVRTFRGLGRILWNGGLLRRPSLFRGFGKFGAGVLVLALFLLLVTFATFRGSVTVPEMGGGAVVALRTRPPQTRFHPSPGYN